MDKDVPSGSVPFGFAQGQDDDLLKGNVYAGGDSSIFN